MSKRFFLLAVITFLFSSVLNAQDNKAVVRNQEIEKRAAEIVRFLPEKPVCIGNPIADRNAWEKIPRDNIIKDAENILKTPIPELPESLYKEYYRNGNRTNYQNVRGKKYRRLTVFVLAECIENKGRFIAPLEATIRSICGDPSWAYPAHDSDARIYDGKTNYIDLGSSNISVELSLAVAWLGDKLSPEIRELIRDNIERRTFQPYEQAVKSGNNGRNWWITGTNNWNSVCHADVVGAALVLIDDPVRRAWYIAAAEKFMGQFFSGFTPDGYCSEGVGYWNYGFGHFVELAEIVYQATGGKVDFLTMPKVKNCSLFGFRMEVAPGLFAAFADCSIDVKPNVSLVKYLSRRLKFGFADYEKNQDKLTSLKSTGVFCFPNSATKTPETPPTLTPLNELRTEFPDAGVLIFRPRSGEAKQLAVVCKGGHNAEQHNHNDVGSFTVMYAGTTPILDPGGEVYTRRTFGSHRYDSNLLNSFGHPVPVINGHLQKTGHNANGKIIAKSFADKKDSCTIEYAAAYGLKEIKKLERTFEFTRTESDKPNSLTVIDVVEFEQTATFETALLTYESWERQNIPEPVWAVGFALEQSLHVVALPCSALRILKRLEHNPSNQVDENKIDLFIGAKGKKIRVVVTATVDGKSLPLKLETI
ncbi:MAG: heparinase II/III-family protein, partial [Planctomycetaceae bacterium]|nr:heparinase II/III-family protein [Planctomycetaceae bacterium]